MSKVRVRFAPSPTGFFHIGSARTALFNWLYARHTGGTFVLRIEDTDKERNSEEYLKVLLDGMRWLGLDWDEGPEVGGSFGPYFQSQRADIYMQFLDTLRKNGRAYDKDGAVFFKVSGEKQMLNDAVYGNVERLEEKDFPIIRSDGSPVFHFVNVVDDICMEITDVIRGQDHLTNSNKHIELFKALDAPLPRYAHIPLILKSDGQGKMSKRDKGALMEEYETKNFLPNAVVNYLSLLGWNPKNGEEIMEVSKIVSLFDFDGIIKSNARFDERKMSHFNQEHLRSLPDDNFVAFAKKVLKEKNFDFGSDERYLKHVLQLCQHKLTTMEDIVSLISYFFDENYEFNAAAKERVFKKESTILRMQESLELLKNADKSIFDVKHIDCLHDKEASPSLIELVSKLHDLFEKKAKQERIKITEYFPPLRFALSGLAGGPDLLPMLCVMGKEKVIKRLENAISKLS